MKKPILIMGATVAILATAAVVVSGAGGHKAEEVDWASKRGQDFYYADSVLSYDVKDVSVNLKGSDAQRYFSLGFSVAYKVGRDVKDATAPFVKAESDLRDRLTMLLSSKGIADLEGVENKRVLKQEILDQVERAVFPDKSGRVMDVYYRVFLIQ